MKENVRTLAADLKAFLASRQEDDLIPAAFSQAAAFVPPETPAQDTLAPQDHLAVEFVRAAKHPATTSAKQTPFTTQTIPENSSPIAEEKISMSDVQTALDQIAKEIHACRRCPLGNSRLHAVPGEGNPHAQLMFIGEGPGFDEDHQGRPFIGRAGQLLDKMIAAMGLKREQVFIANIAKCHPMIHPENPEAHGNDRAPNAGEIAVCRKFIERQIAAISPKYVVALGGVAAKALISDTKT